MELDSTLIEYMKKKAEYAKLEACVFSVQSFVIAVFFCIYGLLEEYFLYSQHIDIIRKIVIFAAFIVAIVLALFNILVCIRWRGTQEYRPDYTALRQSHDTVKQAYIIGRPHLIFNITLAVLMLVASGFIYILLSIFLDRSMMSGVYGRITVAVFVALALYVALPSIDRIFVYREMLGEMHRSIGSDFGEYVLRIVASICIPLSISAWYVLRFFTDRSEIAWIVFPMVALFGFAIVYLIKYVRCENNRE